MSKTKYTSIEEIDIYFLKRTKELQNEINKVEQELNTYKENKFNKETKYAYACIRISNNVINATNKKDIIMKEVKSKAKMMNNLSEYNQCIVLKALEFNDKLDVSGLELIELRTNYLNDVRQFNYQSGVLELIDMKNNRDNLVEIHDNLGTEFSIKKIENEIKVISAKCELENYIECYHDEEIASSYFFLVGIKNMIDKTTNKQERLLLLRELETYKKNMPDYIKNIIIETENLENKLENVKKETTKINKKYEPDMLSLFKSTEEIENSIDEQHIKVYEYKLEI